MRDDYYEYDDIQNEKIVNDRKQKRKQSVDNYGKEKIKKTARTSILTSVIGALSDMEEFFGAVWKHGAHYDKLTEQEKDLRDRWMDCRDSILKRGNNSIRILEREINKCVISDYPINKYQTILKNNKENQNGRR